MNVNISLLLPMKTMTELYVKYHGSCMLKFNKCVCKNLLFWILLSGSSKESTRASWFCSLLSLWRKRDKGKNAFLYLIPNINFYIFIVQHIVWTMGYYFRIIEYFGFHFYILHEQGRLAWPVRKPMDILISTPGVLRKFLIAGLSWLYFFFLFCILACKIVSLVFALVLRL